MDSDGPRGLPLGLRKPLAALAILLWSPLPGAEPALQLSFSCPDCPGPFVTLPRSRLEIDFAAVLSAGAEGASEIRGWTITVVTEGGAGLGAFLDSLGKLPPTAGAVEGAFHHAYT